MSELSSTYHEILPAVVVESFNAVVSELVVQSVLPAKTLKDVSQCNIFFRYLYVLILFYGELACFRNSPFGHQFNDASYSVLLLCCLLPFTDVDL